MGEEIEFENGQKWSNYRLSWAPDLDLDLGSGHGHYLFFISHRVLPVYKISPKSKKLFVDGRTHGRTDGNLPPIVLGRLPKFGKQLGSSELSYLVRQQYLLEVGHERSSRPGALLMSGTGQHVLIQPLITHELQLNALTRRLL